MDSFNFQKYESKHQNKQGFGKETRVKTANIKLDSFEDSKKIQGNSFDKSERSYQNYKNKNQILGKDEKSPKNIELERRLSKREEISIYEKGHRREDSRDSNIGKSYSKNRSEERNFNGKENLKPYQDRNKRSVSNNPRLEEEKYNRNNYDNRDRKYLKEPNYNDQARKESGYSSRDPYKKESFSRDPYQNKNFNEGKDYDNNFYRKESFAREEKRDSRPYDRRKSILRDPYQKRDNSYQKRDSFGGRDPYQGREQDRKYSAENDYRKDYSRRENERDIDRNYRGNDNQYRENEKELGRTYNKRGDQNLNRGYTRRDNEKGDPNLNKGQPKRDNERGEPGLNRGYTRRENEKSYDRSREFERKNSIINPRDRKEIDRRKDYTPDFKKERNYEMNDNDKDRSKMYDDKKYYSNERDGRKEDDRYYNRNIEIKENRGYTKREDIDYKNQPKREKERENNWGKDDRNDRNERDVYRYRENDRVGGGGGIDRKFTQRGSERDQNKSFTKGGNDRELGRTFTNRNRDGRNEREYDREDYDRNRNYSRDFEKRGEPSLGRKYTQRNNNDQEQYRGYERNERELSRGYTKRGNERGLENDRNINKREIKKSYPDGRERDNKDRSISFELKDDRYGYKKDKDKSRYNDDRYYQNKYDDRDVSYNKQQNYNKHNAKLPYDNSFIGKEGNYAEFEDFDEVDYPEYGYEKLFFADRLIIKPRLVMEEDGIIKIDILPNISPNDNFPPMLRARKTNNSCQSCLPYLFIIFYNLVKNLNKI